MQIEDAKSYNCIHQNKGQTWCHFTARILAKGKDKLQ